MLTKHQRYREIDLNQEYGIEPYQHEGPLKILLFKRAAKLRSHAVRHLTNLTELETTWKRLASVDMQLVMQCISDLEKAGCPYFLLNTELPPCNEGRGGCQLFKTCPESVRKLEKTYLDALVECIRRSGQAPRYAYYFSDMEQSHVFCMMPEMPVVLKASLFPDQNDIYNLMTCYSGAGISFTEMRDIQVEKIKNEARAKNTSLCSHEGWGLDMTRPGQNQGQGKTGSNKRGKKAGRPRKYHKRGSGDWRKYLDEY